MKEIFYFYSRQHQLVGKKATFDLIREKIENLDLSEFMKFCIEFKVPVKKETLMEVFRKNATNTKEMNFSEFVACLSVVAEKVNEERIKLLLNKIKKLKNIGKKPLKQDNKQLKSGINKVKNDKQNLLDNNNRSDGEDPNTQDEDLTKVNKEDINDNDEDRAGNEEDDHEVENAQRGNIKHSSDTKGGIQNIHILEEIQQYKTTISELKMKSVKYLIEEFLLFLQIDNEKVYRTKMKGYVLPFHSDNKNYRIPVEIMIRKIKKIDPRTAEEIKRIIASRKDEKLKATEENERVERLRYFEQKKKLRAMNEKVNSEKRKFNTKDSNYAEIAQKHDYYEKEKETKLTWDQLESLNFQHFITNRDDDFHPEKLLGDEYDSEDAELFLDIHKTLSSKKKKEDNIFNYNNAALVKASNGVDLNSTALTKADLDRTLASNQNNKSKQQIDHSEPKNYHSHNYFNEKTERRAKELEREQDTKKAKVTF